MAGRSIKQRYRKRKSNTWKRSRKFIPDGDQDFAAMARTFAQTIEQDPARYILSASDAEVITDAVNAFRDALAVALRPSTRTKFTIMTKDERRTEAERVIRKFANLIRANEEISAVDKKRLRINARPKRVKQTACPQSPPYLRFVRSDGGRHVLDYMDELGAGTRAKPPGAVRIELFVGLVEPGKPIPARPDDPNDGVVTCDGRPFPGFPGLQGCTGLQGVSYVRSFTKNPIAVAHPVPAKPMVVVYWGRWAGSTGDVGPFSATVVAGIEGKC